MFKCALIPKYIVTKYASLLLFYALCVICVPFLYYDKCFRSMEVEGMTLISVMTMVVEGSPNMMRKGQILFYITNKKNVWFWPGYHIFGHSIMVIPCF